MIIENIILVDIDEGSNLLLAHISIKHSIGSLTAKIPNFDQPKAYHKENTFCYDLRSTEKGFTRDRTRRHLSINREIYIKNVPIY
ncbi:hypothetical protein BpHYR1_023023 [Brachionus plicatilis]|uniref:Uncharacterized protein n=1 Tax=Brachionus plicatilis TaxID=10195 RepID=A0A3M7P3X2_BRAPC|nr:hypothetical protein BpHYR1_023023 [Brachionus plicatilis]